MKVSLKTLGQIVTGNTPSKSNPEYWHSDDISFVKPDILPDNKVADVWKTKECISEAARSKSRIVGENAIFVTCIGSIGKIGIATKGEFAFNQQINAIIPNSKVFPKYLAYVLLNAKPRLTVMANAPVVPIINKSQFGDFQIDISENYEEQKRISAILDSIESIITQQNQALYLLDKLVKSRFVEIFGDPVTNSKGYPIHQLSDHILFLTSGSRGWAQYYTDKGEWFITIKNVKDCRISVDDVQCINPPKNAEAERTRLREGDLLISITADLGRTGVVTKEIAEHGAYNNQHLTCIRLDRLALDPLYAAFFMESEAGKRQFEAKNMSAVKAGLNFDSIRSLRLIVPPLALQKEFTAFVAEVDKSKLAVKQSLEKLETLKKSLMQQYFG